MRSKSLFIEEEQIVLDVIVYVLLSLALKFRRYIFAHPELSKNKRRELFKYIRLPYLDLQTLSQIAVVG